MATRYLFKTSGDYAGFVRGDHLFTPAGERFGFIRNGNEVYKTNGSFLGYLLDDDRIARSRLAIGLPNALPPFPPLPPLPPLRPLRRLRMPRLPPPYIDVLEEEPDPSMTLHLTSRIAGEFKGWEGESEYELVNGQTWKQARYLYRYKYKYRPVATIWKKSGKYFMEVEGGGPMVEVRRV